MCAGREGNIVENPGFLKDGKWDVKWEGLMKNFGLPNPSEVGVLEKTNTK